MCVYVSFIVVCFLFVYLFVCLYVRSLQPALFGPENCNLDRQDLPGRSGAVFLKKIFFISKFNFFFRVISLHYLHFSFYSGYTSMNRDNQNIKMKLRTSAICCIYSFFLTIVTSSNDVITFSSKFLPLSIFLQFQHIGLHSPNVRIMELFS